MGLMPVQKDKNASELKDRTITIFDESENTQDHTSKIKPQLSSIEIYQQFKNKSNDEQSSATKKDKSAKENIDAVILPPLSIEKL